MRQLREARGWSQNQLAVLVGITPSAIGLYERGLRMPAGDILIRLAHTLHVNPDFIIGASDSPEIDDRLPPDWKQAVEEATRLGFTPNQVREILRGLRRALGEGERSRRQPTASE